MFQGTSSPLQRLQIPLLDNGRTVIWMKRDDLLQPFPGNKGRKLKYHVLEMQSLGVRRFYTFGGPFSNHVAAASLLCRLHGFEGMAFIRGEIDDTANPVLNIARRNGLELMGLPRNEYARRRDPQYLTSLVEEFGPGYLIPEGGAGELGARGCTDIVGEVQLQLGQHPDHWYVAAGTGTTAAGIARMSPGGTTVNAVSALREKIIRPSFDKAISSLTPATAKVELSVDHHFGGMGRWTPELVAFMSEFERQSRIALDPVYTAKAMWALHIDLRSGRLRKHNNIVFVHTGGAPGRQAFDYRYPGVLTKAVTE